MIGSNARHDHNLLTAALVAPTKRFAMGAPNRRDSFMWAAMLSVWIHRRMLHHQMMQRVFVFLTAFFMTDCLFGNIMQRGVRVTKRLDTCIGTNSLAIQYQLMQMRAWMHGLRLFQCMVFIQKMIVHLHTRRLAADKKKITFLCQQKRQDLYLIQMVISSQWRKCKSSGIVLIRMDLTDEMAGEAAERFTNQVSAYNRRRY